MPALTLQPSTSRPVQWPDNKINNQQNKPMGELKDEGGFRDKGDLSDIRDLVRGGDL